MNWGIESHVLTTEADWKGFDQLLMMNWMLIERKNLFFQFLAC